MQRNGTLYTIFFAAAVCGICSVMVSGSYVGLRARQEVNQRLEKQRNILEVSALKRPDEKLSADEIRKRFQDNIQIKVVDLATGDYAEGIDPLTYNPAKALNDPAMSAVAPKNDAGVMRIAKYALVYQVLKDGQVEQLVLPVYGRGLWSVMYGFLALDKDTTTIRGITFYEHGETPGLGAEIENPKWKALWIGRKAFDDGGQPAIKVMKGQGGPPDQEPYRIDALSGATLTSRGVQNLVNFWMGDAGFGPYIGKFREQRS